MSTACVKNVWKHTQSRDSLTCRDMERSITILVDWSNLTECTDQYASYSGMSIPSCCVKRSISVVILQVRLASWDEQYSGRCIMSLLTWQMKGWEATLVLDVSIGFVFKKDFNCLTVSFPSCFMQRSVSLQVILGIDERPTLEQQVDYFDISFRGCQMKRRKSRLWCTHDKTRK